MDAQRAENYPLRRRDVAKALVRDRDGLLVVAGLGSPAWDVTAAGDDGLLAGPVALDFSRRAFDPQQLRRQREVPTVVEIYFQNLFLPLEADFLGPVPGSEGFAHG